MTTRMSTGAATAILTRSRELIMLPVISRLSAPYKTQSCPRSLDICASRYDTRKLVIPVETGIRRGGGWRITHVPRSALLGVLTSR